MMVRPELPYSPGMEVMGVVDACGAGTEEWQGRRVVAMPKGAQRRLRRVRDLPGGVGVRHARRRSRSPARPRSTSRSISPGSGSSTAPSCKPARACSSTRPRADRARPRSSSRSTPARACSRPRAPTRRCSSATTSAPTSRSTTTTPTSPRSCSPRPANRGVDVVFDNVGEAVMEKSLQCTAYNGRYLMMGFASNKLVADEPFIVPAAHRAREPQAVRRAARVPGARDGRDAQDRDGLELRDRPSSAREIMREIVDLVLAGHDQAGVGETIALRGDPGRDRGDGEPRDDRPHDRHARTLKRPHRREGTRMTDGRDRALLAAALGFAGATGYNSVVAIREQLPGEPLGIRIPLSVSTGILVGWGSAVAAPWPMPVVALLAAGRRAGRHGGAGPALVCAGSRRGRDRRDPHRAQHLQHEVLDSGDASGRRRARRVMYHAGGRGDRPSETLPQDRRRVNRNPVDQSRASSAGGGGRAGSGADAQEAGVAERRARDPVADERRRRDRCRGRPTRRIRRSRSARSRSG